MGDRIKKIVATMVSGVNTPVYTATTAITHLLSWVVCSNSVAQCAGHADNSMIRVAINQRLHAERSAI